LKNYCYHKEEGLQTSPKEKRYKVLKIGQEMEGERIEKEAKVTTT
jgi:hypothetical protein